MHEMRFNGVTSRILPSNSTSSTPNTATATATQHQLQTHAQAPTPAPAPAPTPAPAPALARSAPSRSTPMIYISPTSFLSKVSRLSDRLQQMATPVSFQDLFSDSGEQVVQLVVERGLRSEKKTGLFMGVDDGARENSKPTHKNENDNENQIHNQGELELGTLRNRTGKPVVHARISTSGCPEIQPPRPTSAPTSFRKKKFTACTAPRSAEGSKTTTHNNESHNALPIESYPTKDALRSHSSSLEKLSFVASQEMDKQSQSQSHSHSQSHTQITSTQDRQVAPIMHKTHYFSQMAIRKNPRLTCARSTRRRRKKNGHLEAANIITNIISPDLASASISVPHSSSVLSHVPIHAHAHAPVRRAGKSESHNMTTSPNTFPNQLQTIASINHTSTFSPDILPKQLFQDHLKSSHTNLPSSPSNSFHSHSSSLASSSRKASNSPRHRASDFHSTASSPSPTSDSASSSGSDGSDASTVPPEEESSALLMLQSHSSHWMDEHAHHLQMHSLSQQIFHSQSLSQSQGRGNALQLPAWSQLIHSEHEEDPQDLNQQQCQLNASNQNYQGGIQGKLHHRRHTGKRFVSSQDMASILKNSPASPQYKVTAVASTHIKSDTHRADSGLQDSSDSQQIKMYTTLAHENSEASGPPDNFDSQAPDTANIEKNDSITEPWFIASKNKKRFKFTASKDALATTATAPPIGKKWKIRQSELHSTQQVPHVGFDLSPRERNQSAMATSSLRVTIYNPSQPSTVTNMQHAKTESHHPLEYQKENTKLENSNPIITDSVAQGSSSDPFALLENVARVAPLPLPAIIIKKSEPGISGISTQPTTASQDPALDLCTPTMRDRMEDNFDTRDSIKDSQPLEEVERLTQDGAKLEWPY